MKIKVNLYYHLRQKAGNGCLDIEIQEKSTIGELKKKLESSYPKLRTHLDNVMVLMNRMIVLDDDVIKDKAEISFLTPVGGG